MASERRNKLTLNTHGYGVAHVEWDSDAETTAALSAGHARALHDAVTENTTPTVNGRMRVDLAGLLASLKRAGLRLAALSAPTGADHEEG